MHGRWEKSCAPLVTPHLAALRVGSPAFCPSHGAAVLVAVNARVVVAGSLCPMRLGLDRACPGADACPGAAPPSWQMLCAPSHFSSLHPRRAQLCQMEVRLLFALGREASIILRGGGGPKPVARSQQSARSCVSTGCAVGGCRAEPCARDSSDPFISPVWSHCTSLSLLAVQLGPLGVKGLPGTSRTWVPASPVLPESLFVSLSICLMVHWISQMCHLTISAPLQDPSSTGCQGLLCPPVHAGCVWLSCVLDRR